MIGSLLGEVPALPLHSAGKYVAGAYVVLFALVLIYVAIMAIRLSRIERDLGELLALADHPGAGEHQDAREHQDAGERPPSAHEQGAPKPESTLA